MRVQILFVLDNDRAHEAGGQGNGREPLAAGRISPPVTGLRFVFNTIKPTDMVCLGLLSEEEAEEDLGIVEQLLAGERVDPLLQYTRSKAALVK